MSTRRFPLLCILVVAALVLWPEAALAESVQDPEPEASEAPERQDAQADEDQATDPPGEEAAEGPAEADDDGWDNLAADPCSIGAEGNWIDWMNQKVTKTVCSSARWFDNFFGTARGDEDREATYGRIGLGAYWDEDDGTRTDTRFRAKVHFPNMDNRVNAVIGRGSSDEILESEGPTEPPNEAFFDDESEWLLGFGYRLNKSTRNRLDLSLGSSFSDSQLDPYVRLRYIYNLPVFKASHLRIRLVPQWQESRGYGATSRISIDRSLGDRVLFRWEASGRAFQERFEGVAYGTSFQVFQNIGVGRAMRYVLGIWGQTGFEHQPEDWGLQVTFRDSIYKEIFFIEVLAGTNFRRRDGDPEREEKFIGGLFFELKFGK